MSTRAVGLVQPTAGTTQARSNLGSSGEEWVTPCLDQPAGRQQGSSGDHHV